MTIGERICVARENAHLTQEELGKKVGTTKQSIYKYEKGIVTNIPMDRIQDIADALNVEAAYLMGWDTEADASKTEKAMEIARLLSRASDAQMHQIAQYIRFVLSENQE